MSDTILMVLCTCPDEEVAQRLSESLVREKLAACVNIVNNIGSIFAWQGKIDTAQESLLLIKTTTMAYPSLEQAVIQQHPYDVPEVIALPITRGAPDYLNWIRENTCTD